MLDVGWQELLLIAVVALVVVGPKDLPAALRTVAQVLRKIRGLSREFQSGFAELVREAELDEIKRKVGGAGRADVGEAVRKVVDPTGSLTADFDPADFARRLREEVEAGPPTRPRSGAATGDPAAGTEREPPTGEAADNAQRPKVD
jgi:sec-independent protein translocase protein TatB